MKCLLQFATLAIATTALGGLAGAQTVNDEPLNQKWAPSEWGADDRIGAPNRTLYALVDQEGDVITVERRVRRDLNLGQLNQ